MELELEELFELLLELELFDEFDDELELLFELLLDDRFEPLPSCR